MMQDSGFKSRVSGTCIARLLRRRGFGIHSPWVYTLLRDVLFEPLPYYAFSQLRRQFPDRTRRQTALDEQLFRLAHYAAPVPIHLIGTVRPSTLEYIRQGAAQSHPAAPVAIEQVVVVEDIKTHADLWHRYEADPAATATFDIGSHRGIAIYNPGLSKQHYKI